MFLLPAMYYNLSYFTIDIYVDIKYNLQDLLLK